MSKSFEEKTQDEIFEYCCDEITSENPDLEELLDSIKILRRK